MFFKSAPRATQRLQRLNGGLGKDLLLSEIAFSNARVSPCPTILPSTPHSGAGVVGGDAEQLLDFFDQRRYRSRFYLRAFYLRVRKGDLKGAVGMLLKAREVRKYMKLVVGDLARCYQRLGWWPQLHELVRDQADHIGRNPVLLDVQAGMLIAQGEFEEADKVIRTLLGMGGQEAYAEGRRAMLAMRRDQDFVGAQQMPTDVLQRGSGGQMFIRRWGLLPKGAEKYVKSESYGFGLLYSPGSRMCPAEARGLGKEFRRAG